jgi:hypothetical protein
MKRSPVTRKSDAASESKKIKLSEISDDSSSDDSSYHGKEESSSSSSSESDKENKEESSDYSSTESSQTDLSSSEDEVVNELISKEPLNYYTELVVRAPLFSKRNKTQGTNEHNPFDVFTELETPRRDSHLELIVTIGKDPTHWLVLSGKDRKILAIFDLEHEEELCIGGKHTHLELDDEDNEIFQEWWSETISIPESSEFIVRQQFKSQEKPDITYIQVFSKSIEGEHRVFVLHMNMRNNKIDHIEIYTHDGDRYK